MIKFYSIIFIIVFSGCSFKTPPNQWQYKSVNAYESYKKNFLSSNDDLANSDFKRAEGHAKKSSNLEHLAKIYLGKCAINNSVGIEDSCAEYKEVQDLVENQTLHSYYLFISNQLKSEDIKHMLDSYKNFASSYINKDFKLALEDMRSMQSITSKLIAANFIKDEMSVENIDELLKEASYYGYKKAVLHWLKIKRTKMEDTQKIDKKIKILES